MEFRPIASSSAGCAYLLYGELRPLLIDAGVSIQDVRLATEFAVQSLAGCLVSHSHGDHCKCVSALLKASVDCYASAETWEILKQKHHRCHTLKPELTVRVEDWRVTAFPAVHDCPGTLGFVVDGKSGGRLLYLTDTAYNRYTVPDVTHMAVEANFDFDTMRANSASGAIDSSRFKRTARNHMSLERLIEMLKANDLCKVQEIWLLHLSDQNSDEDAFKEAVQRATGKPVFIAAKKVPA